MPDPKEFKDKPSFMKVCIPMMMKDKDMENDQAVAACSSMWERKERATTNARQLLFANAFREVEKGGKTFLVVPGVPLREQVLNSYFVPAEEIARSVVSWNGTPITLDHPQGNNRSVNVPDPDVTIIGHFYNARYDPKFARMSGEYWIDVEEAQKSEAGQKVVANIKGGKILETSTGYYADEEPADGEFQGRPYSSIHRNILNDHIAILTNKVGACSVKDGCGVNRNIAFHNCECDCPFQNEDSLDKHLMDVRGAFDRQFAPPSPSGSYAWIREIFDSYVIVEAEGSLYQAGYGKDPEGAVLFAPRDQWQKVEVQYVAANAAIPDYQTDHLPRTMLEGFTFNKGSRTPEQLAGLRAYMAKNGIDKPVTVMRMDDGEIKILDGNHRVSMAAEFQIDQIPVRVVNEQLQPIDPELMYTEWAHGQDQGYLNRESRSSTSTTVHRHRTPVQVPTNHKEPDMKSLQDLISFLQGKGIKVKQNEAGEFLVEEPTTPADATTTARSDAESLSAEDVAALKSLASLAPVLNALNATDLPAQLQVVTNFAKSIQEKDKSEREQLVASIKANAANVYSDEELAVMPSSALVKLNAQLNMSYVGLGGPHPISNQDEAPLAIQPVLLVEEKE